MNAERLKQIEEIFNAAIEVPPNELESFFKESCGTDEELRRNIEALLVSENSSGNFLDTPPESLAAEMFTEQENRTSFVDQEIGHYKIKRLLGKGGMGEVYLAEDTNLNRKIALKFLSVPICDDKNLLRRFKQEAFAASALNHPNILTIYEFYAEGEACYLAAEYIEGETLRETLRRGKLTLKETLNIAEQTAFALAAAHKAGIVHRDIKPENIMLREDGFVKVLDFGLAKLTEKQELIEDPEAQTRKLALTQPGTMMGTAPYMSPEQIRGRADIDARTDIWSFGVVLFEMLTGRVPFAGETVSDMIASILKTDAPHLSKCVADCPPELDRIIDKALAKNVEERYQVIKDLALDIKSLKHRLEFEAELERSAAPHRTDVPTTQTGWDAPKTFDRTSSALTKAVNDAAPNGETGARQTSSAEYIATEIKRHKKGSILIAALAMVAIAVSILFLNFRSARALTEKDTILLTDFVNTTGDSVFDGTLKQALAVQLGQSPFLNIFSDDRARDALKFMGRSSDERVTRDVGREISQRQGLKAMLVGSIASMGNHYVITLEAINAQTGDAIAREQAVAENKEQVLHALGEAAMKLRDKLGESLQSIQKFDAPIEQGTTSSLEAFKAYSLGVEQHLKGKYLEAIPLFKRAAEIDPDFALAYARMAAIYYNSSQYDLAAEASQKAYELRDRVSERERLYISAGYYDNVTGELEKYLETLELWKITYPRAAPPHNNLAYKYNELGQFDKALEEAREAIRLNPNSASGYSLLAGAFVGLNRFDEAKEIIGQALAQKLETTIMHRTLYRIAFVQGDATTMKQQIEWTKGKPDEYVAQNWQAETAAFSGHLRKAKEFSNHAFKLAAARDLKDVAAQIAAGAAMRDALLGDCRLVKEQTAKALGISRRQLTMIPAGNALATCGEISQAQTIIDELVKRFPKDTVLNKVSLPLVQARIELQRGNPAQAIQLLETTRLYEGAALFQIAYLRGQSYLNQQRGTDAAAEFQKILDHKGWQAPSPLYPLAQLGLARAAALSGDTTKARQAYQDFFALWRDADPDIPILQESRREYEKLK
jgi:serine/threonine protein kinase/tetratricopeptide (TPR) repeat protein